MPRYDCTTPNKNRRHKRARHSASKGKGVDAKLKQKKRMIAETSKHHKSSSKKKEKKTSYEPA